MEQEKWAPQKIDSAQDAHKQYLTHISNLTENLSLAISNPSSGKHDTLPESHQFSSEWLTKRFNNLEAFLKNDLLYIVACVQYLAKHWDEIDHTSKQWKQQSSTNFNIAKNYITQEIKDDIEAMQTIVGGLVADEYNLEDWEKRQKITHYSVKLDKIIKHINALNEPLAMLKTQEKQKEQTDEKKKLSAFSLFNALMPHR